MGLADMFKETDKITVTVPQLYKALDSNVRMEYLEKMLSAGVKKSHIMEVLEIKSKKEESEE